MVDIYDNFLDKKDLEKIQTKIFSKDFNWINEKIVNENNFNEHFEEKIYNRQFVHPCYQKNIPVSQTYFDILPIIEKIGPLALIKIKLNCIQRTNNIIAHGFHTDVDEEYHNISTTAVFYLNTNNGKTIIKNHTEINSIENRLVLFPSKLLHSGTSCTDENFRYVLNLNFF